MASELYPASLISDQLLNNLKQGKGALFLGTDLPREVTGLPSRADLARDMAQYYHLAESLPLAEVAQRVSQAGNRFAFTDFIRNALDTAGRLPTAFHQNLVQLVTKYDIKTIITTAYDDLLEVAFRQAKVGINRVIHGSDVNFIRANRPTLLKLYGDVQQPETLVVTEHDHLQLLRDRDKEELVAEVRRAFKHNTLLFYGYNLDDPDFKFLFDQIAENQFARLAYAVWPGLPEADRRMWRERGIMILEENPLAQSHPAPDIVKSDETGSTGASDLILPQLPNIISLQTYHDLFVALDPSQEWMLIGNAEADTAERFSLLHLSNGKVALRASNGNYVTTIHRGRWSLLANAPELGEAQQFDLHRLDDGRVSFKTVYHRYITAMDDQPGWQWELRAETEIY